MTASVARNRAIAETVAAIRRALEDGATAERLARAGTHLAALAARHGLFDRASFPISTSPAEDRTYLLHQDPDGSMALYAATGFPGQSFHPHDHGAAWAIVAAIEGSERHCFWRRTDGGTAPGPAVIKHIGEKILAPGDVVTMAGHEIHSIHACGDAPILHLHMYATGFSRQADRLDYNLESGTAWRMSDADRAGLDGPDFAFDDNGMEGQS